VLRRAATSTEQPGESSRGFGAKIAAGEGVFPGLPSTVLGRAKILAFGPEIAVLGAVKMRRKHRLFVERISFTTEKVV